MSRDHELLLLSDIDHHDCPRDVIGQVIRNGVNLVRDDADEQDAPAFDLFDVDAIDLIAENVIAALQQLGYTILDPEE